MLNTKAFAATIKKLRSEKGLSQPQLAELMVVSRSTISMWELGTRLPDVGMLDRLARCLGVDLKVLLDPILDNSEETIDIIVVEDVPALLQDNVGMIQEVIPSAHIRSFERGADALSYAQNNNIDNDISVAFLDIELDENMNGLELARHLKDINPYIDIIFVTNHAEYLEQAIYDHCSGYVIKPLTRDRIRHEMANLRFSKYKLGSQLSE